MPPEQTNRHIVLEKKTVKVMVEMFCRSHHHGGLLCSDCVKLLSYSEERIDRCRFKRNSQRSFKRNSQRSFKRVAANGVSFKRVAANGVSFKQGRLVCSACPVHCYQPEMREKIRQVMRFSGPRMLLRHPVLALFYVKNKFRSKKLREQLIS